MLHDPRDVKIMIEKAESSSHLGVLRFGGPIVHQDIVGAGHIAPFEKDEPARDVPEILRVNSIDHIDAARRTELQQDGCDRLHVFHFAKFVTDLDRHGRAAECQKYGRRGGLQHNIRADALDGIGRLLTLFAITCQIMAASPPALRPPVPARFPPAGPAQTGRRKSLRSRSTSGSGSRSCSRLAGARYECRERSSLVSAQGPPLLAPRQEAASPNTRCRNRDAPPRHKPARGKPGGWPGQTRFSWRFRACRRPSGVPASGCNTGSSRRRIARTAHWRRPEIPARTAPPLRVAGADSQSAFSMRARAKSRLPGTCFSME